MLLDELLPLQPTNDGVQLNVQVTPKAAANKIGKVITDAKGVNILKVYVTAAPEDGKANAAVIKLLAKTWKLTKSDFEIIRGLTDRRKVIHIHGDSDWLMKYLKVYVQ